MPTERELGDRFGVSRGTVRQALAILETQRLVIRHQGRGTFVADPVHSRITSARTQLVGAMVYEREYYFEPVVQAASAQAAQCGYALATGCNSGVDLETQQTRAFINNDVRGVMMTPRVENGPGQYQQLVRAKIPVIFMDSLFSGDPGGFCPCR